MKKFCAVEFVDDEGEQVVTHAFMTDEQKVALLAEFASRGIPAEIHDLTPPQVVEGDSPAVMSGDDKPRLAEGN